MPSKWKNYTRVVRFYQKKDGKTYVEGWRY
jgi:hypothetical protein